MITSTLKKIPEKVTTAVPYKDDNLLPSEFPWQRWNVHGNVVPRAKKRPGDEAGLT